MRTPAPAVRPDDVTAGQVEQLASDQRGIAELVAVLAWSPACVMCAEEDPAR